MQASLTPRGRTWLGYAFWCAFAIGGFILTLGFEGDIANYRYGAGGWPRVLFIGILLFATIQVLATLHKLKRDEHTDEVGEDDVTASAAIGGLPVKTVAIPILYIILLQPIGFFVATPPFLAGVMISMGERRPLHVLLVTGLIYALVILVFIKLLYVPLPIGTWPGFYDVGNWLLTAVR